MRHPDDGDLLLFAAEAQGRYGRLARAQELLAAAAGRARESDRRRTEARLARWLRRPAREPRRLDRRRRRRAAGARRAPRAVAELLPRLEGRPRAVEHVRPPRRARPDAPRPAAPARGVAARRPAARGAGAAHAAAAAPDGRVVAPRALARARGAGALRRGARGGARGAELEPEQAATLGVRGLVLAQPGRSAEAAQCFRAAVERAVDYRAAAEGLIDASPGSRTSARRCASSAGQLVKQRPADSVLHVPAPLARDPRAGRGAGGARGGARGAPGPVAAASRRSPTSSPKTGAWPRRRASSRRRRARFPLVARALDRPRPRVRRQGDAQRRGRVPREGDARSRPAGRCRCSGGARRCCAMGRSPTRPRRCAARARSTRPTARLTGLLAMALRDAGEHAGGARGARADVGARPRATAGPGTRCASSWATKRPRPSRAGSSPSGRATRTRSSRWCGRSPPSSLDGAARAPRSGAGARAAPHRRPRPARRAARRGRTLPGGARRLLAVLLQGLASRALGRHAWVLDRSGRRREAMAEMKAVVERHPDYRWGIRILAEWTAEHGSPAEAVAAAERFMRIAPESAGGVRGARGGAAAGQGRGRRHRGPRARARARPGPRRGGGAPLRHARRPLAARRGREPARPPHAAPDAASSAPAAR